MDKWDKFEIFKEKIKPHLDEVHRICKEEDIPFISIAVHGADEESTHRARFMVVPDDVKAGIRAEFGALRAVEKGDAVAVPNDILMNLLAELQERGGSPLAVVLGALMPGNGPGSDQVH